MSLDFSCCVQVHPNEVHRRKRVAVFEDSGRRLPWSFVCSQRRTGTSVLVTVHQIPNTCSLIPKTDSKTLNTPLCLWLPDQKLKTCPQIPTDPPTNQNHLATDGKILVGYLRTTWGQLMDSSVPASHVPSRPCRPLPRWSSWSQSLLDAGWVVRERSVVIGPAREGDEEGDEERDEGQAMCQGGHCQESSSAILRFARSGKCAFYRGDVSAQIMWNSRGGIPFHAYNRFWRLLWWTIGSLIEPRWNLVEQTQKKWSQEN